MAPPAPRGAGRRRVRLPSIRSASATPSFRGTPAPEETPEPEARKQKRCACPAGEEQPYQDEEGMFCANCGTKLQDLSLTSEITFGENAAGAAVVNGTTLQQGQRHTHIAGLGYRNQAPADSDQKHANAMRVACQEIKRITNLLHIAEIYEKSVSFYELARINHLQRPLAENAAIAIYAACREQTQNTTLLIDLAEVIRVNVFDLGSAYKKFLSKIGYSDSLDSSKPNGQKIIEIEPLIYKFARRLEFGDELKRVANDASAILARMDRDWMITGRQPMGLIGACLIIAARMNNFRRTLREVVYVVRAGEVTILKRLNEFSQTAAAKLTVDQFRKLKNNEAMNSTLVSSLPPSLAPPPKKKRKQNNNKSKVVVDDESQGSSSRRSSIAERETSELTELRKDKDGFAIPRIPRRLLEEQNDDDDEENDATPTDGDDVDAIDEIDADDAEPVESDVPKRKRGRPAKMPLLEVKVTEEDLQVEEEIEKDIANQLERIQNDKSIEDERGPGWYEAKKLADAIRAQESKLSAWDHSSVNTSETIDEEEFEDDPEVAYCLLTARETKVKEQIWVSHNHDWLRQQQEKVFKEEMDRAMGKKKRQGPRQKMARRGDGSVLGSEPVSSAADASSRMLSKRATRVAFSRNVNYDQLQKIYQQEDNWDQFNGGSDAASVTSNMSRDGDGSTAPAVGGASPTPDSAERQHSGSAAPAVQHPEKNGKISPAGVGAEVVEIEDDQEEEEEDDDEEDEDSAAQAGAQLPTFGEDEEEGEDQPQDIDEMEEAASFGIDTGGEPF